MAEARKTSEEANRRLADIEARLPDLGTEIEEMRVAAEKEAAAEEARIKGGRDRRCQKDCAVGGAGNRRRGQDSASRLDRIRSRFRGLARAQTDSCGRGY